jgi:hypothetical protein
MKKTAQQIPQQLPASEWGVLGHIGGRVEYRQDRALGTITELNWTALKVKWDDGQVCVYAKADAKLYLRMVKF